MKKRDIQKAVNQAFIENADPLPKDNKSKWIPILFSIIFCLIIGIVFFNFSFKGDSSVSGPYSKIIFPLAGTVTGEDIKVTAETKNIGEGSFIWLAVDKPKIGLCWPKKQLPKNTKFSTTIREEGPKGLYIMSIYVLNENFHKQWKEWKDREIFGGVHMPPESKRLASTKLILRE